MIPLSTQSAHAVGASIAQDDRLDDDGWVSLTRVRSDYRSAIGSWPLPLPKGYILPAERKILSMEMNEPYAQFEKGFALSIAFLAWQDTVATAASLANDRGDADTARDLLQSLADGHGSDIRHQVFDDPTGAYLGAVVDPARDKKDFGPLQKVHVAGYLADPLTRQIARDAGDI